MTPESLYFSTHTSVLCNDDLLAFGNAQLDSRGIYIYFELEEGVDIPLPKICAMVIISNPLLLC